MTLDELLCKTYDKMNYNCFHFMVEAYEFFYGRNIRDTFAMFLDKGITTRRQTTMFHKCEPKDAEIVLINYAHGLHCGIVVKGRVLHITEDRDVKWQPLEHVTHLALKVKFYAHN